MLLFINGNGFMQIKLFAVITFYALMSPTNGLARPQIHLQSAGMGKTQKGIFLKTEILTRIHGTISKEQVEPLFYVAKLEAQGVVRTQDQDLSVPYFEFNFSPVGIRTSRRNTKIEGQAFQTRFRKLYPI